MYTKQISYITGVKEGIKTLFAHRAMFRINITSTNISPHAGKGEGVDTIPLSVSAILEKEFTVLS